MHEPEGIDAHPWILCRDKAQLRGERARHSAQHSALYSASSWMQGRCVSPRHRRSDRRTLLCRERLGRAGDSDHRADSSHGNPLIVVDVAGKTFTAIIAILWKVFA